MYYIDDLTTQSSIYSASYPAVYIQDVERRTSNVKRQTSNVNRTLTHRNKNHNNNNNTMAPKRQAATSPSSSSGSSTPATTTTATTTTTTTSSSSSSSSGPVSLSPNSPPQVIIQHIWQRYIQQTPPRTFLLDAFMAFLVVVGAVQFVYCVLAGNYFVLTASLRMQTSPAPSVVGSNNKSSSSSSSKGKNASSGASSAEDTNVETSHERTY
ncbi:Oligosaccharyl transferase subunit Dad1 [Rasamsonia emersonii CBS 393.64]|uniref:Dolichyl-diphosphooligosaccharide--protein glycosyltransferase subunit OST2 n=1 Tax=Rasamsonia emersonii (strain ATCC 16479 / CBS 393.64 / IMI 116815) TaxID=1408163 RepID=A0A0F4YHV2_RASE3|nr:Oligosaccharyl transferase subunit Dad1 [Rasamsonia emersonii CBS 393.64]KKA17794.1 Oligosaccharyl transferase subunit Dad1 [Rasamsonia emersonii CBS 393.64]